MPKVIQIRDVPDDVRDALAASAAEAGLSLSGYVRRELETVALRGRRLRENAAVARAAQARVGETVPRDAILAALHEGRDR